MTVSTYMAGCASASTGNHFEKARSGVCKALGIETKEFDWICCGGGYGAYLQPSYPEQAALENLRRAREAGTASVLVGCAGCIRPMEDGARQVASELAASGAAGSAGESSGHRDSGHRDFGSGYSESVELATAVTVQPLWERIARTILEDETHEWPGLNGLKVACYYGCRFGRGRDGRRRNVGIMEAALGRLGAEVVDFEPRDECNGGMHALTRTEIVEERTTLIVGQARVSGAEVLSVLCSVCQLNLETRPLDVPLPAPAFEQLVGLAIGLDPGTLGLSGSFADLSPLKTLGRSSR